MLLAKAGVLSAPVGGGTQRIGGLGFLPKALIFWSVGTTADDVFQGVTNVCIGFWVIGGASACVASRLTHGVNASNYVHQALRADRSIYMIDVVPNTLADGRVTATDQDSFTLTWLVANAAYRIVWLALGGLDLQGAAIKFWQTTTGGTGTLVPVTGIGFQPDFLLHAAGTFTALPPTDNATRGSIVWGGAAAGGYQWAWTNRNPDGTTTAIDAAGGYPDRMLQFINADTADAGRLTLERFDPDGFTARIAFTPVLNFTVATLALRGVLTHVGHQQAPLSSGTQNITTPGFSPAALLITHNNLINFGISTMNHAHLGIGMAAHSTLTQGCAGYRDTDNVTTTNVPIRSSATNVAVFHNTTPTLEASAAVSAWLPTGYQLTWVKNVSSLFYYQHIALTGSQNLPEPSSASSGLRRGRLGIIGAPRIRRRKGEGGAPSAIIGPPPAPPEPSPSSLSSPSQPSPSSQPSPQPPSPPRRPKEPKPRGPRPSTT